MPQKIKKDRRNEVELIKGSGLNMGMLERLFESIGCKLVTVKVVEPKKLKTTDTAKESFVVTHCHYEQQKKSSTNRRRRIE